MQSKNREDRLRPSLSLLLDVNLSLVTVLLTEILKRTWANYIKNIAEKVKFGPGHFTFNWRLTLTLTLGKFLQRRS